MDRVGLQANELWELVGPVVAGLAAYDSDRTHNRNKIQLRTVIFTWPQLGPFFVPACPPLTAINGD